MHGADGIMFGRIALRTHALTGLLETAWKSVECDRSVKERERAS